MAKNTSTRPNGAARSRPRRPVDEARRDAANIRREAEAEAARIRAEAEEHARRVVLDARASADGVRAEGMELVLSMRQVADVLRSNAELLLRDIETVHSRMAGELAEAAPAPPPTPDPPDSGDDVLEVPEFVARD